MQNIAMHCAKGRATMGFTPIHHTLTEMTRSGDGYPSNAIGAWCPFLDVVCAEVVPHHKATAVAYTCSEHASHNTVLQSGAQPIAHQLAIH